MSYVTITKGKPKLNKRQAFCQLLENQLPEEDKLFTELFKNFDSTVKSHFPTITLGALNNAHGNWYEWLLAIAAWNYHVDHEGSLLGLMLPNVSRFDVVRLYIDDLHDLVVDLRHKVEAATSVQLVTSNPDFVLIDPTDIEVPSFFAKRINRVDDNSILLIEEGYKHFIAKCGFDEIVGYLSVKTSLRPDRRLQISHEGSLMKAIYTHLQTRQWIIKPQGLKYYAIAAKVGEADRKALKTVATHSITTVHTVPQAAVDEVFTVNSLAQAKQLYQKILSPSSIGS